MPKSHTPRPYGLHPSACGGSLRRKQKGRGARTLSTRYSMHLVLRSTQARGHWSFIKHGNRQTVKKILHKHARRTGIKLLGTGNAGNHLHLRVKIQRKKQYFDFIRAVTGEIALKIRQLNRVATRLKKNFWDQRPFSSIVSSLQYENRLVDYININELEGHGYVRAYARLLIEQWKPPPLETH